MGVMLVPVLGWAPSVAGTVGMFCVMAVLRRRALDGLERPRASTSCPDRPGAMMGARTASAQLGYMVGAAGGGAVLAISDFATLGIVLFVGMVGSAYLLSRVRDPQSPRRGAIRDALPEPVPD